MNNTARPHRLAVQDAGLSRRKRGFDSPWGHHRYAAHGIMLTAVFVQTVLLRYRHRHGRILAVALLMLCCLISLRPAAAADGAGDTVAVGPLIVSGVFARATPGPVRNGAAYLTITNTGEVSDKLLSVSTTRAARAELHTHLMDGGVARMRHVTSIEIPPGETVSLAPGKNHIMLMRLTEKLLQHTEFPLMLTFENAGSVNVTVSVGSIGAMAAPDPAALKRQ